MIPIYVIRLSIKMPYTSSSSSSSSQPQPFCKVCKDAGCPESDYTSHFVKDQPGPNGKVVCPTLLNQSCRICNQPGHTSSYCKQYKPRVSQQEYRREEPRHQEPRHQEYRRDEPRHQDYRREEPRHQDYRRDEPREYRRDDYRREETRREEPQRRAPYAHPHGPRVRLQLDAPALATPVPAPAPAPSPLFDMPPWGTPEYWRLFQTDDTAADLAILPVPEIDVRKVKLNHEPVWSDEPVVSMDSEHRRILEDALMSYLISDEDFDLIVTADEDNGGRKCTINRNRK